MSPKRRSEGGTAIVETALVLALFYLILFGVMEFSILLFNRAVIINASREGARLGALFNVSTNNIGVFVTTPPTDAEISAKVMAYSCGHLISFSASSGSSPTVSVSPTWTARRAGGAGTLLRVSVDYPFQFLLLPRLFSDLLGGTTLSAETVMRME